MIETCRHPTPDVDLPLPRLEGDPAIAVVGDLTTQTSKTRGPYATDFWTLFFRGALSLR